MNLGVLEAFCVARLFLEISDREDLERAFHDASDAGAVEKVEAELPFGSLCRFDFCVRNHAPQSAAAAAIGD